MSMKHAVYRIHYINVPIQYDGCKNDSFQMKKGDKLLIFSQNIDCAPVNP